MGCYYLTDLITNIPILPNEKVHVFFLQQNPFGGYGKSHCYSSTYCDLWSLYYQGEYNDYGSVEKKHGVMLPTILDILSKSIVEMPVGDNQYHERAISRADFTFDKMWDADMDGRLLIPYHTGRIDKNLHINQVMVKDSTIRYLIEKYKIRYDLSKNISFQDLYESGIEYLEKIKELDSKNMFGWENFRDNLFCRIVVLSEKSEGSYGNRLQFTDLVRRSFMDKKFVLNSDMIYQSCVVRLIKSLFGNSRRMFIKPAGDGSQDQETDAQEFTAHLILAEAEKLKHYFDE